MSVKEEIEKIVCLQEHDRIGRRIQSIDRYGLELMHLDGKQLFIGAESACNE